MANYSMQGMNKLKVIKEFASLRLSENGYTYFVHLISYYVRKFGWPKIILDENPTDARQWSEEDYISFTNQFLLYIIENQKLRLSSKIPDGYLEHYFKSILVSYVANKIKEKQRKTGISFDDTKRISLKLLEESYFNQVVAGTVVWNNQNSFTNPIMSNESISIYTQALPRILITEKTKHFKPRVKMALNDIFSLVKKPISQPVLINQVYSLFDQTRISHEKAEGSDYEIREEEINRSVASISALVKVKDIPLINTYFFSESKSSLKKISKAFSLPKSTVHFKIDQFRTLIQKEFIPENDEEGIVFLKKLKEKLDDLQ